MHMARQAERRSRFAWRLASVGIVVFLIVSGFAATQPQPASEDWKVFDRPGKFITALCAAADALWIGTEDKGLWRLDLSADPTKPDAWKQFIGKDGPNTEHVYAIAVDAAGRVWVGTVNQGVAVYNGVAWRTFGVLDGCAGERVFALAADADSKRGHVWIGTDHGLACWSPDAPGGTGGSPASAAVAASNPKSAIRNPQSLAPGTWRNYTRADGLPSDQIYALAVDKRGRVWVGTECDGLAWADPPYKKWTCVRAAAERSGDSGEAPGLAGRTGPGLPSNLSNDLLVLRDGTVVYSTNYGLGMGRGGGLTWTSWQGLAKQPYENYCRGLAEDPSGRLWIATRHLGLARLDGRTGDLKRYRKTSPPKAKAGEPPPAATRAALPNDYVFDVAVTGGGDVWAGTYGGGLARLKGAVAGPAALRDARPASAPGSPPGLPGAGRSQRGASPAANPPLPQPAAPPTLDELNAMLAQLSKVPFLPPEKQPVVVRLDDDWLTKGDWVGRYGRYNTTLCAYHYPNDVTHGPGGIWARKYIGADSWPYDALRHWMHWLQTDNPNTLTYHPVMLAHQLLDGNIRLDKPRRQAEWDDHGEVYSMARDGPHIMLDILVPPGPFYLSFYFFNKDGHSGNNRFRDYDIVIKPLHVPDDNRYLQTKWSERRATEAEMAVFQRQPVLARGRLRDFWGGTYKRFLIGGGQWITVQIRRNHSFNTTLSGWFLDPVKPVRFGHDWSVPKKVREERKRAEDERRQQLSDQWRFRRPEHAARFLPGETADEAAERLYQALETMSLQNAAWREVHGRPYYAALLRFFLHKGKGLEGDQRRAAIERATTCYYQVGLWLKWEAGLTVLGRRTPRQEEERMVEVNFGRKIP